MTYRWQIIIEVYPHSSGNGRDVDQAAAGEPRQTFHVEAEDMRAAFNLAHAIASGIKANPAVWEAPVVAVSRLL